MLEAWISRERALRMGGAWAVWGGVCWFLGVVFAVLGVIADAANITLGLEPTSWLLLAIALFVASIPCYIGWTVSMYLHAIEAKKEK